MKMIGGFIPYIMIAIGLFFIIKATNQKVQKDKSRDLSIGIPLLIIGAMIGWRIFF
jgi:hypothetical protein